MAKLTLNPIVEEFRGQLGDLVFRESYGQTVVGRKPATNGREPTPEQLAARERFRQAAAYGRTALNDPQTRQHYEDIAHRQGKPVFSVVMADFLNPPTIDEVDIAAYTGAIGDAVYIRAHDDLSVQSAFVRIMDASGSKLEAGDATLEAGGTGRWAFHGKTVIAAGTTVRILVTVSDRPGGLATREVSKSL